MDKGGYVKFRCIRPYNHEDGDRNPSMTMLKDNGFVRCWSCGYMNSFYKFCKDINIEIDKSYFMESSNSFISTLTKKSYFSKTLNLERNLNIQKGELLSPFGNSEVMSYLHFIGYTNDTIQKFDIQYIKEAYISFIKDTKGTYIKNRIAIPIYRNNQLVNLELRDYTGKQKPKVIYPKGSLSDTLFNIDNLDFNNPIILVEGIKLALLIWQEIYKNVTSMFGACLSNNQSNIIQNKIKSLWLFPDNDKAGLQLIDNIEEIYNSEYFIILLKRKKDDKDETIEEIKEAINNKITSSYYFLNKYNLIEPKKEYTW
jgi:DNA primase